MKIFCCIFILFIAFASGSIGQPLTRGNPFLLNLDYARFHNDEKSAYLEIYYSLFSGPLRFRREGNCSRAAVTLNTEVLKQQSGERVAQEHITVPFILEDTSSVAPMKSLVRETGHLVPPGKYLLDVVAFDSTDPIVSDTVGIPLEIEGYSEKTAVSDLELCSSIKASTRSVDPFFKNSYEVIPNPTRVFGGSKPVLYAYSELYGVDTTKEYVLEHEIVDNDGVVQKKSMRTRRFGSVNSLAIASLNVFSLNSGGYWLRFTLRDLQGAVVAGVRKRFFINNPNLPMKTAVSDTSLASIFRGLTAEEVDKELLQVSYLLTEPEKQFLSQLTALEAKRKFLQDFWVRHEAGSAEGIPLKRSEFLRRVSLANERYTRLGKEGWRTDRGRVLIVYGEPDQIDRHPNEVEGKPYESWHYYQIEGGVDFVFLDRNGFGNYELVHSTKRGELRDDDWQTRR
jgi:GWxTD domain-containing protein